MSLIFHGHNNSFNLDFKGVFGKNCCKLLLRNVVNCGSTCMASQDNFCAGSAPDPIFLTRDNRDHNKETRVATYTCRYSSGHLIPNSF